MKKLLIVLLSVAVLFTFMPAAAFAGTEDFDPGEKGDREFLELDKTQLDTELPGTETARVMTSGSFDSEDGEWVFAEAYMSYMFEFNDGTYASGWTEIDTYWFYFEPSTNVAVTGWNKLGGYWYYFATYKDWEAGRWDYTGGMYDGGAMKVNGKWYYFGPYKVNPTAEEKSKQGKLQNGWITDTYYDEYGEVAEKICYYADPAKDSQLALGWKKIGSYWYYFEKRESYTDEVTGEYIDFNTGMMYDEGPMYVNGKCYFFPDWKDPAKWGKMALGWAKLVYTFEESYSSGDVFSDSETYWYYADPAADGQLAQCWKKIAGKWYYFEEYYNWQMVANKNWKIGGKLWAFNKNGSLHETQGWVDLYEDWYLNGKQFKESYWVYTDAKGIAKTGWQKISGEWYLFDDRGYMEHDKWATDKTGTMWLGSNGKIAKSKWVKVDFEWYYLKASGYRAENEWAKDSKGWMYMGEDGIAWKGQFLDYKGHTFYLKDDGYMACNETIEFGPEVWVFDENGYGTRIS